MCAALLLAGCVSSYEDRLREREALRAALGRPTDDSPFGRAALDALADAALGATPSADPETERALAREVSLPWVADLAVQRNPDVGAALSRWTAFLERVPQQEYPPLPVATATYNSMFRMGTAGVTQTVPFPAKLVVDARAALAEARAQRGDLVARVNLLREQAVVSVARLFVARREVAIVDENIALLDRLLAVARARYGTGATVLPDVLRAELERANLAAERTGYVQNVQIAESALNVLLDRAPDAPLGPVPALPPSAPPAPLAALFTRALERRPELGAARALMDAARERRARAGLEWVPDLVLEGAYVRDFNLHENHYAVSGGLSLPLWWPRIQAQIREAEAAADVAAADARTARNRVLDEVRQAAARLAAARERLRIVVHEALPPADQNVKVSEAAYVAGQLDFLDLIDTQRTRLVTQLALVRAEGDEVVAAAALARALGEPGVPGAGP